MYAANIFHLCDSNITDCHGNPIQLDWRFSSNTHVNLHVSCVFVLFSDHKATKTGL